MLFGLSKKVCPKSQEQEYDSKKDWDWAKNHQKDIKLPRMKND